MGKSYADDLRLVAVRLDRGGAYATRGGGGVVRDQPEFGWPLPAALSSPTGSVSPDKFGGYKGYALAKHAERLKRWIAEQPDLTLLEIQARACSGQGEGCRLVGVPVPAPPRADF